MEILIGRFHPLLVHLPIGILLLGALFHILIKVRKTDGINYSIRLIYLVGGLTSILSAICGYILSLSGGYDSDTLFWHKWLGILVCAVSFVLFYITKKGERKSGEILVFSFLIIVLSVTGHLGGELTHGSEYLAEPLDKMFGSEEISQEEEVLELDSIEYFKHVVQPIFEDHCISCHNPSKMKGELDLSSDTSIMIGGLSGAAVVGGHLEKSELIKRINLKPSSKKFMPPNGKKPLTNVEVKLIEQWVKNGVPFTEKITKMNLSENAKFLIASYLGIDSDAKLPVINLPDAPKLEEREIEILRAKGLQVNKIADGSSLIDVSFIQLKGNKNQIGEALNKIGERKSNIYKLNLAGCEVSDDLLKELIGMNNLHFLRLENNPITDNGTQILIELRSLQVLNLNNTEVSNEQIELLKSKVKTVYFNQIK